MPRGRKAVPTEQRLKRGESPTAPPVVIGGRAAPPMPRGLNSYQRTAWLATVKDLAQAGILDRADAAVIEAFAVHWGRARQARALVNSPAGKYKDGTSKPGGLLRQNSQGWVANPALGIEERAWREVRQLADQLPLSPWGRARLGLTLTRGGGEGADAEMDREIGPAPRLRMVGGSDA